jgi:hypothetical protein
MVPGVSPKHDLIRISHERTQMSEPRCEHGSIAELPSALDGQLFSAAQTAHARTVDWASNARAYDLRKPIAG